MTAIFQKITQFWTKSTASFMKWEIFFSKKMKCRVLHKRLLHDQAPQQL